MVWDIPPYGEFEFRSRELKCIARVVWSVRWTCAVEEGGESRTLESKAGNAVVFIAGSRFSSG